MSQSLINPYIESGRWWRGNTHTHTRASDGVDEPQDVIHFYAEAGYDFLAITDHNLVLPLSDYDPCGLTLIQGEELTAPGTHVVGLGLTETLPPGQSTQNQIDLIRQAGGLSIIAHPHWMGFTPDELVAMQGHLAIELTNQVCFYINGKGDSVAWWDHLLTKGRRCWGVSVDDCHDTARDGAMGWIMVDSPSQTWSSLREAMLRGSFYASTGPQFETISSKERQISLVTSPCVEVRMVGSGGAVMYRQTSESERIFTIRFDVPASEPYARVEIEDAQGRRAWSQPFWTAA
jgi:hypothetical protein